MWSINRAGAWSLRNDVEIGVHVFPVALRCQSRRSVCGFDQWSLFCHAVETSSSFRYTSTLKPGYVYFVAMRRQSRRSVPITIPFSCLFREGKLFSSRVFS
jgi:hypothetical protein